jgi:hypothetical protein
VHTTWRRTSFRTRFRRYTVHSRLELRNVDVPRPARLAVRVARAGRGHARSPAATSSSVPATVRP